ncbi:hypothetical protein MKX08_004839 [Trichoderma sp. CBMAI-0020]|nr:hypothetical protein MKX08_004839 [Trichoderma sp. CBMAI-0020]
MPVDICQDYSELQVFDQMSCSQWRGGSRGQSTEHRQKVSQISGSAAEQPAALNGSPPEPNGRTRHSVNWAAGACRAHRQFPNIISIGISIIPTLDSTNTGPMPAVPGACWTCTLYAVHVGGRPG